MTYISTLNLMFSATIRRKFTPFTRCVSSESAGILAANLTIKNTTKPKELVPNSKLVFGRTFTDHMLEIDWQAQDGWGTPKIIPVFLIEGRRLDMNFLN